MVVFKYVQLADRQNYWKLIENLTSIILKSDDDQNEWGKTEIYAVTNLSFTKPHSHFTHYVTTMCNSCKIFVTFALAR